MMSKIFVVRAEAGFYTTAFKNNCYIGLGPFRNNAFSDGWNLGDKAFLKKQYKSLKPDADDRNVGIYAGQVFRFINEMKIGDIVVCPYGDGTLLIGRVEGEMYYATDNSSPYCWRRKVKWLKDKINRSIYSKPLWNALRGSQTIFTIKYEEEILSSIK